MARGTNRRNFLRNTSLVCAGFWMVRRTQAQEKSPNEKLAMASIGIGGKGSSDSADAARHGEMVAICDIDLKRLEAAKKRFPNAKTYTDFRKMLEENEGKIDAVTVSTPDHCHAVASVMAMKMGMHCFCQKPLTRTIYEARVMGQVAKEKGVQTQMGNQGTALDSLRKAAALVKAGVIGEVKEVHVWTNRPIWPQGLFRRPKPKPCPEHVMWDLWLGPAPYRTYADGYHPFSWRGWWDFGTGALGDMACHTMNLPYMALDLRDPVSVQAETSGHNCDSFPKWSIITYEFPATDKRPAVKMIWYDGGKLPDPELLGGKAPARSGSLMIGSKAKLYSPHDYGGTFEIIGDVEVPEEVEFEKSPGHFEEWIRAIKTGKPAMSNFPDYASKLTETVLIGNLAVWATNEGGLGPKLEWDAENMRVKNCDVLDYLIKPEYREGYSL